MGVRVEKCPRQECLDGYIYPEATYASGREPQKCQHCNYQGYVEVREPDSVRSTSQNKSGGDNSWMGVVIVVVVLFLLFGGG